ncbi:C40 family peptidase [Lysobacter sp. A3-1-A15]|uniref:C40 family peptidase n=1 Tax=Novilysobacter viscosus TaxID=3098602 RepID=UPI0039834343
MTTLTTRRSFGPGRTAATAPTRPGRTFRRSILPVLLCLFALPVAAQELPSTGGMSADAGNAAGLGRSVMADSMTLSDRALVLATDLNRMVGPRAATGSGDGKIKNLLQSAMALIGTPYRWGGTSPDSGFDCSGLVGYVFRNTLGIELPRVSREMAKRGRLIDDRSALAEGDLVFFGKRGTVDHVGIYVGGGQFVHAPRTGKDVMVSRMDTGYWSGKFMSARRVEGI